MLLALLLAAVAGAFVALRLRTYLQPFQQEEYDALRLFKWWLEKRAFDRWATLGLLIMLPCAWLQPGADRLGATAWLLWRARQEPNPLAEGKKPLVPTARATQVYWLAALLVLVPLVVIAATPCPFTALALVGLVQAAPLFLILANALLRPLQLWRNRMYLRTAAATLAQLNPTIVGITGSFGKTSTKTILAHILSAQAPTLATPGSINTPLGITTVVRTQLQPQHQYFLAEMGAYGPGSIARLCRLAPPALSCITAIGPAHYERFKSLAAVARAKFEIAEATRSGGVCVLNIDGIPAEFWRARVEANPASFLLVGSSAASLRDGDVHIEKVEETAAGLHLTLRYNGERTDVRAPLYGPQAGNIAVAFALALRLGVPKAAIVAALASVPAAPHRLNVRREGARTLIDDSYNANPAGFAAALHTLSLLAQGKGRRVLVTPGMVELGDMHADSHTRLGNLAAQNTDVVLAVAPARMPTFTQAIRVAWGLAAQPPLPTVGGPSWRSSVGQLLVECATLAAARAWLTAHGADGDVVLFENDLPDRYEARWRL